MKAMTYTAARENLASTMNKVCRNRAAHHHHAQP